MLRSTGYTKQECLQRWQKDEDAPQCKSCKTKFTFFFRRHHCRRCGLVHCANCSSQRSILPRHGYGNEEVRACDDCLPLATKEVSLCTEFIPFMLEGALFDKQGDVWTKPIFLRLNRNQDTLEYRDVDVDEGTGNMQTKTIQLAEMAAIETQDEQFLIITSTKRHLLGAESKQQVQKWTRGLREMLLDFQRQNPGHIVEGVDVLGHAVESVVTSTWFNSVQNVVCDMVNNSVSSRNKTPRGGTVKSADKMREKYANHLKK